MLNIFSKFNVREYRVSVNQDDWVTPEETLMDSSSDYSDLETPISPGVFRLLIGLIFLVSLVMIFFVFKMSILDHEYFSGLAYQNKTINFSVTPPRGAILDRNGKLLVKNIPSFDLVVISRELPKDSIARVNLINTVARALNMPAENFKTAIETNFHTSGIFFAASNINKDQALAVKQMHPKGFYIITGTKRQYVDGSQFSNVIGYVGKVAKNDLTQDNYYLPTDTIGKIGIEAEYEDFLRGQHGKITFSRKGQEGKSEEPVIGNSVNLNINFDIQKKLYNSTFAILKEANISGAAAIIQNPQNGQILAMVSFPSFDNNVFNDEVSQAEFKQIFESKYKPMFNRVTSGLYNPGSTIKPLIGMAALEENIVKPSDAIQDCISISIPNPFKPDDPYVFKNWRVDLGAFNLKRSIANSCNIYFFTVGGGFGRIVGLGAERIVTYLHKSFANIRLGVDLPGEAAGFVPSPDWKTEKKGEPWYQGDTYNISIGQGDLLVTPLWLNTYISAIANGGVLYQPQIANKITDQNNNIVKKFESQRLGQLPFRPDVISEIKNDMHETVVSGTARLLQDIPIPIGAKTGTTEVVKGRRINALFTAFAPLANPEISITVLMEGSSSNEGYAIRVAREVLKWYFTEYQH